MSSRSPEERRLSEVVEAIYATKTAQIRLSAAWLATEAMLKLDGGHLSPPLVYSGCHMHLRQVARELLRGKGGEKGDADADQHELFVGLQKRYPVSHAGSMRPEEREYVLLEYMTQADIDWNVARLRAEADAKSRHADALAEFGIKRAVVSAA